MRDRTLLVAHKLFMNLNIAIITKASTVRMPFVVP